MVILHSAYPQFDFIQCDNRLLIIGNYPVVRSLFVSMKFCVNINIYSGFQFGGDASILDGYLFRLCSRGVCAVSDCFACPSAISFLALQISFEEFTADMNIILWRYLEMKILMANGEISMTKY